MTMKTLSIFGALFLATANVAHAGLTICNETAYKQGISIGYGSDGQWVSEGWWNITPGSCATVVGGDLKSRYYYYRAEINGGDFDGGGFMFCTSTAEYTIYGDEDCGARGYDREDFREIDTGETAKDFTLTLDR